MRTNFRNLRRLIYASLLLWALWACWLSPISPRIGPAPQQLADGWKISSSSQSGFDEIKLHAAIESVLNKPLNLHSIVLERHGQLVAEYYQGGVDRSVYGLFSIRHSFDAQQLHDVRSVGKSVTSLLYGIALQQGSVPNPQAYVFDQYPELQSLVQATPAKKAMQIEHLLSMSSGLDWQEGEPGLNNELRLFWKQDIAAYVLGRPLIDKPGSTYRYNGGCTAILADLIVRGSHQTFKEFARRNLFEPLGIVEWDWVEDTHGRAMPFNGLRLLPRDLLKIGRLILNHGRWNGKQIVSEAWLASSFIPRFATGESNFQYGYQWRIGSVQWHDKQIAWYAGFGNGGQRLFIVPELDLTMVTNAGAYDQMPTAIQVNRLLQKVVETIHE